MSEAKRYEITIKDRYENKEYKLYVDLSKPLIDAIFSFFDVRPADDRILKRKEEHE